jgi:hypothetical protein
MNTDINGLALRSQTSMGVCKGDDEEKRGKEKTHVAGSGDAEVGVCRNKYGGVDYV